MSGAHIHLLLNHIPVFGIGFGILILAYAYVRKKTDIAQVGMSLFVLSGLAAIAAYLTGEGAEEVVEELAGISHALIERHEEVALFALIASVVLGTVSIIGLWLSRKMFPQRFIAVVLVLALVGSGLLVWTGNLGGQINHPEIRGAAISAGPQEGAVDLEPDEEHDQERR